MNNPSAPRTRLLDGLLLGVALAFPTAITWIYFVGLRSSPAGTQQTAYLIGKLIQFALPICWVVTARRTDQSRGRQEYLTAVKPRSQGIWLGIGFGMIVGATMWGLYAFAFRSTSFFEGASEQIRGKVLGMGLTSPAKYAAVSIFYAACHSLLEEYYWRWFVFRELRARSPLPWAILVSSLGFMAHHVLVLAAYFGGTSPATWLFSGGVAVGGAVWAWLYDRSQSLLGPWSSHCLVDAAIFWIGYDAVRDGLQ